MKIGRPGYKVIYRVIHTLYAQTKKTFSWLWRSLLIVCILTHLILCDFHNSITFSTCQSTSYFPSLSFIILWIMYFRSQNLGPHCHSNGLSLLKWTTQRRKVTSNQDTGGLFSIILHHVMLHHIMLHHIMLCSYYVMFMDIMSNIIKYDKIWCNVYLSLNFHLVFTWWYVLFFAVY